MINIKVEKNYNGFKKLEEEICSFLKRVGVNYEYAYYLDYMYGDIDYMNVEEYTLVYEMRRMIEKLEDIRNNIRYLDKTIRYNGDYKKGIGYLMINVFLLILFYNSSRCY